MAATTLKPPSCLASATSRVPMRPAAPVMAMSIMWLELVSRQTESACDAIPSSTSGLRPWPDRRQIVLHLHRAVDQLARAARHARGQVLGGFHVDAGVVFHRRVGVLQLVAGEDADDLLVGRDDLLVEQLVQAGDAGGAGRLAAETVAGDHGAVFEDLVVGHFAHHAVHHLQRAQGLGQIDRPADLDGAGDGVRVIVGFIHRGVELLRDVGSRTGRRSSAVPRRVDSSLSVLAPVALMIASRGIFLIRPSSFSSMNALPKAEQLPRFPPGTMTQSGGSQSRASRMRYMIDFCPSRRKGLTLFIR